MYIIIMFLNLKLFEITKLNNTTVIKSHIYIL